MSSKRTDPILSQTETVIGAGVKVRGTLVGDGDMVIDGHLVGEIKTNGNLSLGVNAVVKASLTATNVRVAGQLTGNIQAEADTHLTDTSKVVGDITTGSLQIDAGGIFMGRSLMTETEVRELDDEESDLPTNP